MSGHPTALLAPSLSCSSVVPTHFTPYELELSIDQTRAPRVSWKSAHGRSAVVEICLFLFTAWPRVWSKNMALAQPPGFRGLLLVLFLVLSLGDRGRARRQLGPRVDLCHLFPLRWLCQ